MILFHSGPLHEIHEHFIHGKTNKAITELVEFLKLNTIGQENKLAGANLHAYYLVFTGEVDPAKTLIDTTLQTAIEEKFWLQVVYAYIVRAEIQIRTGHHDQCLEEAQYALEVSTKLESSPEVQLIQGISYHYQIRALVEKYWLYGGLSSLDFMVANQEKFDNKMQKANQLYQYALQLNNKLENPYLDVLLASNFAWILNIEYWVNIEKTTFSTTTMPELPKQEMMTAFYHWYSTAKQTRFIWGLARFFQFGAFSEDWYSAYGFAIRIGKEVSEISIMSKWYMKAHRLFRRVGDALWTQICSIYHRITRYWEGDLSHTRDICEKPLL